MSCLADVYTFPMFDFTKGPNPAKAPPNAPPSVVPVTKASANSSLFERSWVRERPTDCNPPDMLPVRTPLEIFWDTSLFITFPIPFANLFSTACPALVAKVLSAILTVPE
ncbi:hypothetical protein D1872_172680 [compost metagenome]